jgi:hypothetical protein
MKKVWETKGPNWDSAIELDMKDGAKLIGYYHGISDDQKILYLAQTKIPLDKYNNLMIKVLRSNIKIGRVIKW